MADDNGTLLRVEHVTKTYRMGHVDVHALRDASIAIRDGELLVIVGASGSGKSTLLNMIGGMDSPTSGKVIFDTQDISGYNDAQLSRYRRTVVGFVFQLFNLIPTLTAAENIQVATEIASDPLDPVEALKMVSLDDRADHFPSQLSGGQQQRVAIARALAGNPRLLLCDEPSGALDSKTTAQMLALIVDLKRRLGKTIVVITHNTSIARIADRVATIHDGAIVKVQVNETPEDPTAMDW